MKRIWIAAALCLGFLSAGSAENVVNAADGEFPVGVAAVDITPDYPVRLNGFGFRREESEGVRQRIWAKALAIGSDADKPLVLITVDTLGIPDAFVEALAKRLKSAGVEPDRLSVTASHTHTAPMTNQCAPTIFGVPIPPGHQAHIDQYTREFREKLYEVAVAALKDRRPAMLFWGVGEVGFAKNRRMKDGPVDHSLPVLAVKEPNGKLRAIHVSYACHCVSLSDNLISGDWAGYAQEMIERQHPGCTALFSAGCGADCNPLTGVVGDRVEIPQQYGLQIADEVNRVLKSGMKAVTGPIEAKMTRIDLPLSPLPTREEWERRAEEQSPKGHHARTQLARLDRGESLMTKISYPIKSWAFGDGLAFVFLPGEVVVDYSHRLRRELDGKRLWIVAYANGCPGYIPSERVLARGGYEGGNAMVYYDIPVPYAPGLEQKIVDAVTQQLGDKFPPPVDPDRTQGSLPRSPQQSLSAFKTKPELTVELVASEPLISSPVAIDFGPDGRLWVAEMYDYPSGVDNRFTPGGRIKVLEDTDSDGRYDHATTFLEGIPFPTGVTVWRNGVLVCAAPDILFAEDTDGDGRADRTKKRFSGFATHNYQARVNSLEYGLDGWVYGSCGLFGGEITSFAGGKPLSLGRRDFRINPDTGAVEPVAGNTQQGRARNDWGNWFGCTNSNLLQHYPLTDHYLRRNPHVAPPSPVRGIVSGPDPRRLFPIAETVRFKLTGPPNRVTAACGLGIYRDDRLGPEYTGNAFTCEPVNNLVHRRVLKADGVSFTATRAADEEASEFLASTDQWFRPVQVRTGPDGGLWVVDMYRYVIEHPTWIPPETLADLDVRAGADLGRIYRVVPRERSPRTPARLDQMSSEQLALALDSPNGWQRDMAQQFLLWRNDRESIDTLRKLAADCPRPETRLHALYTLSGLDALQPSTIAHGLADGHAGIRRHALRLSEQFLNQSPDVAQAVLRLLDDPHPQIQLQLAYTLGEWSDPRAAQGLARLVTQKSADVYLTAAVFSSLDRDNVAAVVDFVLEQDRSTRVSSDLLNRLFAQLAIQSSDVAVQSLLLALLESSENLADDVLFTRVAAVLQALARSKRLIGQFTDSSFREPFEAILARARTVAESGAAPDQTRIAALRLLGQAPPTKNNADLVEGLLVPHNSLPVQTAAVETLAQFSEIDVPQRLLSGWQRHSPQLRERILDTLLSRPTWTARLLESVEQGSVAAADIDLVRRQRLTEHPDQGIRDRAAKLLVQPGDKNRQQVIDQYAAAVGMTGDPARGKAVFEKHCSACHRLRGVGRAVGPDLSPYGSKPPQALLIAVLDPNQAVDPRYHAYAVALTDGRLLSGVIIDETSTSLTIVSPEGKEQVILRTDLEALRNTGKSLMPEGLEKNLPIPEMADLLAWFSELRPVPKTLPGNQPEVVRPGDDGLLALTADKAEIYGDAITFETPFQNVGYWHAETDHVRWQIDVPHQGRFEVWLDWACAADSAGNSMRVEAGEATLKAKIASTGRWDKYRRISLGTVELPAGRQEMTVRPDGPLKPGTALLDLKALYLVPPGRELELASSGGSQAMRLTDPATLARSLLNDAQPQEQRQKQVEHASGVAAEVLAVMIASLQPGTDEEYRRIPWIWRVAIAAGKRNDAQELRSVLNVSLPKPNEPLHDWQAVVVGGGVINGVSLSGGWPRLRIEEILRSDSALQRRWNRAIELAQTMADDEKTRSGTRYDALRMVAMQDWEDCRAQLSKYLQPGIPHELQMGAVSGLADIQSRHVAAALLEGMPHYSERNRNLALDALLRTPERAMLLLDAVADGNVSREQLGEKRTQQLRKRPDETVRMRAAAVLKTNE